MTNYFNYKGSTPLIKITNNNNKREIQFQNCPNLFQSPKRIILDSSSYKSFILQNKPNKTFEMKYPTLSINNSSTQLLNQSKPLNKESTIPKNTNKGINLIPRPRLKVKNNMNRNKPINYFNTFNLSQQANQSQSRETISNYNTNDNNIDSAYTRSKESNKSDLISVRSFLDELTNVKQAIKENLYYHRKFQKNQNSLREYITSIITSYLIKKPPNYLSANDKLDDDNTSTLLKTIHLSSKYKIELKLISYSIYFKEINKVGNNKTIILPFEFIVYFLCCQKQIDLIFNLLSYNSEKSEFIIEFNKLKFLSQVSIDFLNYSYKDPITSLWITMAEIYQFTTILPQMTFTLLESINSNTHQKLCHFTQLLDSQVIINLMKDNFANWDLLVLNSFSVYKAFRKELLDIFTLKQRNSMLHKIYSKISINNSNSKFNLLNNTKETIKEDEEKLQNEQLGKHSCNFIITFNHVTQCIALCSFKIEIKTENGLIKTLMLSLKQLKQIVMLSDQWSLHETIRRLLIIDDNYYPRLNVLCQSKGDKVSETTNSMIHKYKRSISINKKEKLKINKKEPSSYSYIENNNINIRFIDPYFINEEKEITVIPINLITSMAILNFSEWPTFIRNNYDTIFNKKFDLISTKKKKGIHSSKSLRIGLIKKRFQNN